MKLLGLDFESVWDLNPKTTKITEIGAILYDWDTNKPEEILSTLVWDETYPESPPELVRLTGITDDLLKRKGIPPVDGIVKLNKLMCEADYIVAHNGLGFDKPIYENHCAKLCPLLKHETLLVDKPWIDTLTDIPYGAHITSRNLNMLAYEHKFINPFSHRAVFDVLTMMEILSRYDINQVVEISKTPMVHAIAKVSFQDKDKAKGRGYYWNPEEKKWYKPMREFYISKEIEGADFYVEVIQQSN